MSNIKIGIYRFRINDLKKVPDLMDECLKSGLNWEIDLLTRTCQLKAWNFPKKMDADQLQFTNKYSTNDLNS